MKLLTFFHINDTCYSMKKSSVIIFLIYALQYVYLYIFVYLSFIYLPIFQSPIFVCAKIIVISYQTMCIISFCFVFCDNLTVNFFQIYFSILTHGYIFELDTFGIGLIYLSAINLMLALFGFICIYTSQHIDYYFNSAMKLSFELRSITR